MGNRKLIRPTLSDLREQEQSKYARNQRKRLPPEQTSAEEYYYLKQMANKTPMVVRLTDGEEIHGVIEWYDKNCIKVNRETEPNLLIPKAVIKYMYKEDEVQGLEENEISVFASDARK
jgi:sRNA-binding regulator protein Hfq